MTRAYKDASENVNKLLERLGTVPDEAQILAYTDYYTCLNKAHLVHLYVEAIRTERNGRAIHHRRFFVESVYKTFSKCL